MSFFRLSEFDFRPHSLLLLKSSSLFADPVAEAGVSADGFVGPQLPPIHILDLANPATGTLLPSPLGLLPRFDDVSLHSPMPH